MTTAAHRTLVRIVATLAVLGLVVLPTAGLARTAAADVLPPAPATPAAGDCPARSVARPGTAPVLAHFYLWFTPAAWSRAKTDYPAIGRYSSDQTAVMKTQVAEARKAGITGFIVGWRSTPGLNSRLAALRDVAAAAHFQLAITYQAQDFDRNPLPVAQVRSDLQALAARYADDPVFHVLGPRPVVALSGTWHYSEQDLRSIIEPVASKLMVLATEKSTAGYSRVAPVVDGDLYYWSSADPQRTPGYQQRLLDMANAVRARCGIWVAPAAPGFDARLVGGHSVVDRRDGATLRSSWQAALATVPDAIGIISWNEFSENTYIEPSEKYGPHYLDEVRALTGAPPPPPKELDSSGPQGAGSPARAMVTGTTVVGALALVTILGLRRRKRPTPR